MKVRATVVLEFFDSGDAQEPRAESVTVDNLEVLGTWKSVNQGRPIFEVTHPKINGVYQHHNVGVALLDLLRVAVIDLQPDWCKGDIRNFKKLERSSNPVITEEIASQAASLIKELGK